GCKLYCCWCAQDLEANYFWESMGFVPLAFRAGSREKGRVHIFWQSRICQDDIETKWWYPFQTNGGAIREDRLVFPIPAGTHWKDVQAVAIEKFEQRRLKDESSTLHPSSLARAAKPARRPGLAPMGGFRFQSEAPQLAKAPRAKKPKACAAKIDPRYLKAARELRDRYLEHVNADPVAPGLGSAGKYHVSRPRALEHVGKSIPLLAVA